jgi:phosphatidylserine/phosphatidylglycerophosphate/cardiolipin synthase-like enzyme
MNPSEWRQAFLTLAPHADVAGPLCRSVEEGRFVGSMPLSEICAASGIAEARSNAVQDALIAGRAIGAFRRHGVMEWSPDAAPFPILATALLAVSLYRKEIHVDADLVEVVLTPPGLPSQLGEALRLRGWVEADLEHTEATLQHLAREARVRLAVLSPFMDAVGASNVVALFKATETSVSRVLVTRCQDGVVPPALIAAMPDLAALGVAVHNYWLPRPGGGYETFHAKAVLADSRMAYLGSANMTYASLSVSMELGTLLRGESARTLASVMDSILSIAPIIS